MRISDRFAFAGLFALAAIGLFFLSPSASLAQVETAPTPAYPASTSMERGQPTNAQSAKASAAYPVMLGHVSAQRLAREREWTGDKGTRTRVGFPRDVEILKSDEAMAALLSWEALPDGGLVAAFSITSPDAAGLRIGMLIESLPEKAMLRFYAQKDKTSPETVGAREVLASIARNLASGDNSDAARTYWTPLAPGAEATVEIELPPGVPTTDVRFSVPRISHLFVSPAEYEQYVQTQRAAASCNLDVSCYQSAWGDTSRSIARMSYVEAGYSYTCTGTLVADRGATNTPYFLSANHCIADQTTASTLETRWFYRSASCNTSTTNSGVTTVVGGATLLYATTITDTSFMKLNRSAPSGSYYSGWWPSLPATNASVVGVHHPTGDLQKISFGYVSGYKTCTAGDSGGSYSCYSAASTTAGYIDVSWQQGITEGGSSGSGLWAQYSDGKYYLVGTLRGGSSGCGEAGTDTYGRFDMAYNAALKQWLDSGGTSTYAVTVTKSGSGTVTSSPSGINCGTDCTENYASGTNVTLTATAAAGSSFMGWSGACSGTAATCALSVTEAKSIGAKFIGVLTNGVQLTGLSGALDSETGYAISVPAGASNLKLVTSGGTGDVDVYVRFGSMPTTTTYDCRSYSLGNSETCAIASPSSGTYYVLLVGYEAYAGVALAASHTTAATVTYALTVTKTGDGGVTSSPAGIDCGSDCAENFAGGTTVVLTATPAAGATFAGWSGACSGTSTSCTLSMTQARSVAASFATATASTGADCVFNWAERNYAELFSPAGATSKTFGPYYYRYYATTNSYLGTSSADDQLHYIGAFSGGGEAKVGTLSYWRQTAGCAQ